MAALTRGMGPVLRPLRPEAAAMIAERSAAAASLETWGRSRPGGPLVWLHGASAGELLGAAPALEALRGRVDLRLLVTHFSPSGAAALPRLEPDHAGYPPLDTRRDCERALSGVRPAALVYAKLDVWPGLTRAAARAGIPVGMINAVVRRGSRRSRPLARAVLRPVYAALSRVGAASEEDAERLRRIGVRAEALRVTGDASFDLAVARADQARGVGGAREGFEAWLPPRPPGGIRLVAGSTWPEDEETLLSALNEYRQSIQLVLAPHRPTEARLVHLLEACRRRGRRAVRSSELARGRPRGVPAAQRDQASGGWTETGAEVIAFDEVGTLAELYTAADVAYVGGGIRGTGLHNVLEPAAAAIPVLFGGRHDRREAHELASLGGGIEVSPHSLAETVRDLLDGASRIRKGDVARSYVETRCGAAGAGAELMLELLGTRIA